MKRILLLCLVALALSSCKNTNSQSAQDGDMDGCNEQESALKMPEVKALVMVTAEEANLRNGPDKTFDKFGNYTVPRGTVLCAYEERDGWWRVYTYNGNNAWISPNVTKVISSGHIPEDKYGQWLNIGGESDVIFYKLSGEGAYKGCVMSFYFTPGDEEVEGQEYGLLAIGKVVTNGIVLPYCNIPIKAIRTDVDLRVEKSPNDGIVIYHNRDWENGHGIFNPAAIASLGEDDIALMLSEAKYLENVEVYCKENLINQAQICNAYIQQLNECAGNFLVNGYPYFECDYFLFDITGDGIPELWIISGVGEVDRKLSVYTYGRYGLENIYQDAAGHSMFYEGEDYILQVFVQMGYAVWNKITYDGQSLHAETVFEEETDKDYKKPEEKSVRQSPYTDKTPISIMFEEY